MNNFFQDIVTYNLFNDWAEVLDWIVDDEKFDSKRGWERNQVASLTNKIKALPYFKVGKTYIHDSQKNLIFPQKSKTIKVIYSCEDSQAKSLIKHIRNGIAHGSARCFINKGELYIEIKDYNKGKSVQTAYICFPISYIVKIHKLYCDVSKAHKNGKKPMKR